MVGKETRSLFRLGKWILALLLLAVLLLRGTAFEPNRSLEELKKRYTYPGSGFAKVMGMEVHYRMKGEGPTLLLLHGTGASLHTWEAWTHQLEGQFRVVSLDLPGFGLTGPRPDGDYSIPGYVAFLNAFALELQLDSFHLAGNSLGGLIAWQYAAAFPNQVGKLILIDPAGMPRDQPVPLAIRLAKWPLISGLMQYITPRWLFRKSLLEVYADDSKVTPPLVDRYFELFLRPGNRRAYVERARQMKERHPVEKLRKLPMPALIQWGAEDEWIPVAHAGFFKAAIPDATLIVYPGTGHVPMEEIPEHTAEDALQFLLSHQ